MLRNLVILFTVSVLAPRLNAQEFDKPGPEHEKLRELAGEWDCVMEMQGQKSKATASYKSICGGMWIESDFQGDLGGLKFQGHGLDGYDLKRKKYVGAFWKASRLRTRRPI